jgi:hypothetical protein
MYSFRSQAVTAAVSAFACCRRNPKWTRATSISPLRNQAPKKVITAVDQMAMTELACNIL